MLDRFREIFLSFFKGSEDDSNKRRKRPLQDDGNDADDSNFLSSPKFRKTDLKTAGEPACSLDFISTPQVRRMMDSKEALVNDLSTIRSRRYASSYRSTSKENISNTKEPECVIVSDEESDWKPAKPLEKSNLKLKETSKLVPKNLLEDDSRNTLAKSDINDSIQVLKTVKPRGDIVFRFSTPSRSVPEFNRRFFPDHKKRLAKHRNVLSISKNCGNRSLDESIRLDEKRKYSLLLREQCSAFSNLFSRSPISLPSTEACCHYSGKKTVGQEKQVPPTGKSVAVIDLTEDNGESKTQSRNTKTASAGDDDVEIISETISPNKSNYNKEMGNLFSSTDWISKLVEPYNYMQREQLRLINEKKIKDELCRGNAKKLNEELLEERIRNHMKITEVILEDVVVLEDIEEELALPKLSPAVEKKVAAALRLDPQSEVLVQAFGLNITRHDIHTLAGTNWLNDEVINFYMNLLIERGKKNDYPAVYAFNTFFYPKLQSSGYSTLRRWTRKVDIFAHEILIIPVHLGVHWCMAAIDFRKKSIRYYDSMGGNNDCCLQLLWSYLQSESMDKKKQPFNYDGWIKENVKKIPQQMNGSDCGMFSCTYAEFLCRNAKFGFSQSDMPYFRRKMVYEILTKELML